MSELRAPGARGTGARKQINGSTDVHPSNSGSASMDGRSTGNQRDRGNNRERKTRDHFEQ
jgi:hypothetical protein